MQSDYKEIYKQTAAETGKSEQTYKDIGNFVFATLYSKMRKPPCLILKLKGIGCWHLRRLRMQTIIDLYPPDYEKKREDFESEYGFLKNENKVEIHNLFKERLSDYDEYIRQRDEVRKIRHLTQTLIVKKDVEDK